MHQSEACWNLTLLGFLGLLFGNRGTIFVFIVLEFFGMYNGALCTLAFATLCKPCMGEIVQTPSNPYKKRGSRAVCSSSSESVVKGRFFDAGLVLRLLDSGGIFSFLLFEENFLGLIDGIDGFLDFTFLTGSDSCLSTSNVRSSTVTDASGGLATRAFNTGVSNPY